MIHNSLIGRCMRIFDGAIKNESLHHFLRTLHGFATLSLDLRTSLEMDGTLMPRPFSGPKMFCTCPNFLTSMGPELQSQNRVDICYGKTFGLGA